MTLIISERRKMTIYCLDFRALIYSQAPLKSLGEPERNSTYGADK